MRTILIACGNLLRGDDGAAQRVLDLVGPHSGAELRSVQQLLPELAGEIADAELVVFLDAAIDCDGLSLEPVREPEAPPALTHVSKPSEIVVLSRTLFGFKGLAFQCRIPVADLSTGAGLSPFAESFAQEAARILLDPLGHPARSRAEQSPLWDGR
jgi:Ni,Fe-hydrogenase maturation factor